MLRPTRQRLRFTRGGGGAVSAFIVSLSQTTVSESEDPGVLIATITSNRSGSTFELIAITGSDPNEPKFSITGTGLYLDQALNYDNFREHQITIRATDTAGNVSDHVFLIEVEDATVTVGTIADFAFGTPGTTSIPVTFTPATGATSHEYQTSPDGVTGARRPRCPMTASSAG